MANNEDGLFSFLTEQYDQMVKFFSDIGFSVSEDGAPLLPVFGDARSAWIGRGELSFLIEESYQNGAKAIFNLWILDAYSEAEIDEILRLGHEPKYMVSMYGDFFELCSPDGGRVLLTLKPSSFLSPEMGRREEKYRKYIAQDY